MAVKTIAELAQTNTIADNDLLVIDDGSRNYSITWAKLKAALTAISSFTCDNTAGTITITLSTGASLTVTPHDPTKQDSLEWDTTPTAGSTKPVTSGGIKSALDDKLDTDDYVRFTGATASTAGTAGIVPAPAAGGSRYLSSEGAWQAPDTTPTSGSTRLITSDAVYAAIAALTVDAALSDSSTNPVQNKIIKAALDGVQTALDAIDAALEAIDEEFGQVVHVTAQTFTEQEKFIARQNIGAISANEVEHKRFGVSGVGQSSPTLTRLYDAVGMTATPSTDVTEGSSDFDKYAPFNRKKCVGNWTAGTNKAVFNVQAYEGDADYAEDGSMGDYVAVEVEPFYYYDQDGILAVSTYQWPGYKIHPVCVDYDGNIRAKTYLPVYALAQDANGKAVSLPGFYNQRGGYNDLRNYAKTYANTEVASYAMIEPSAVWHYEWLLMTIEFATTNMQSIMNGAVSMRYADDKIEAVPGANMIVVGSIGSNFVVGQTIYMGASYSASVNVRTDYNRITAIDKCDADGTLNPSGSYYRFTYDGTNRSSSIVVNTWAVSTRPWCTGATAGFAPGVNAVKGHTGSPVNNTNGKYPMRYRWRENVYGNQNMTTLDLADLRVADGESFHLDWYFLADPRKYIPFGNYGKADIQNTAKGWVKLGVSTPVASYVNGYIKELGFDTTYPWVKVPILTSGGSASTYYSDYAFLVSSNEVRCVRRGGHVNTGGYAGPVFFLAYDYVSHAAWYCGATLYMLQ